VRVTDKVIPEAPVNHKGKRGSLLNRPGGPLFIGGSMSGGGAGCVKGASLLLTKTSELREREVVNLLDGKRLGLASDLEIDIETGRILAIVVPGPGKFLWLFGKNDAFVIPWERIKKIGVDVILVEAPDYIERENR
jgi:YlmC/YmxH family sporulation protein